MQEKSYQLNIGVISDIYEKKIQQKLTLKGDIDRNGLGDKFFLQSLKIALEENKALTTLSISNEASFETVSTICSALDDSNFTCIEIADLSKEKLEVLLEALEDEEGSPVIELKVGNISEDAASIFAKKLLSLSVDQVVFENISKKLLETILEMVHSNLSSSNEKLPELIIESSTKSQLDNKHIEILEKLKMEREKRKKEIAEQHAKERENQRNKNVEEVPYQAFQTPNYPAVQSANEIPMIINYNVPPNALIPQLIINIIQNNRPSENNSTPNYSQQAPTTSRAPFQQPFYAATTNNNYQPYMYPTQNNNAPNPTSSANFVAPQSSIPGMY